MEKINQEAGVPLMEHKIPKVITKEHIKKKGEEARTARLEGKKLCCCSSCGIIVENDQGEFLLIERTKGALGFASVAGHGLDTHDSFIKSAYAELKEEVDIEVDKTDSENPLEEIVGARAAYANECGRKPSDEGYHAWKIYKYKVTDREGGETEDDGVASHRWVNKEEIRRMAELTKAYYEAGKPEESREGDSENPYKERLEPIWVVHFAKAGVLEDFNYNFVLADTPEIPIDGDIGDM